MDKRQEIQGQNPELTPTEVSRLLGERWKCLSEEEKRPYMEQSRAQTDDFKKKNPAYKYRKSNRPRKVAKLNRPDNAEKWEVASAKIEMVPTVQKKLGGKLMWLGARALSQGFLEVPNLKNDLCRWIKNSMMVATSDVTSIFPKDGVSSMAQFLGGLMEG
jgi:DNA-binding transcriptional regulator PaaX